MFAKADKPDPTKKSKAASVKSLGTTIEPLRSDTSNVASRVFTPDARSGKNEDASKHNGGSNVSSSDYSKQFDLLVKIPFE